MKEYRVIYFTRDFGSGVGSPKRPWVAYEGADHSEAQAAYSEVHGDLPEITTQFQVRDVTDWVTVPQEEVTN